MMRDKMRSPLIMAGVALLIVLAVAVRHVYQHKSSTLMQGSEQDRLDALQELSGNSLVWAERQAYAHGLAAGEHAAEQKLLERAQSPTLLAAAKNWKEMILAKLKAQQENEKTLDAMHFEETAKKVALAEQAAEATEPAALKEWEKDGGDEVIKKREAQARLANKFMHSEQLAVQRDWGTQKMELHQDQQQAAQVAAKLFKFCAEQYPGNEMLRKFCFEKLSSPPHHVELSQPRPEAEQFTAPTLKAAIEEAHESGMRGLPEYAVFHPDNGPAEAFKIEPVAEAEAQLLRMDGNNAMPSMADMRRDESVPSDAAVGVEQAGEVGGVGDVSVTGSTLEDAIKEAHGMGLKGAPKYVTYNPAHGPAEVFEYMGKIGSGQQV